MNIASKTLAATLTALAVAASGGAFAAPDWSKVPVRTIHVFHPGIATYQWVTTKGTHSGVRGLNRGETCAGCHEDKGELNFDIARLKDTALEPVGAPKTATFPVNVQAAYDAENLYVRLHFTPPADAAAGALRETGSPRHLVKAAIMLAGDKVAPAPQMGCWATCHNNARSMPGADAEKRKYVEGADLAGGVFYDYMQWQSGEGGKGAAQVDGHIAQARVAEGGKALVKAEGTLEGSAYTVTFTRKLTGGEGDVALADGKSVPMGIAIHADSTVQRFHHVSLGYLLTLGGEGDIKAVKF